MADVFDRPMFKNTAARDRLKDIAGIERFDKGGPVESPLQQRRVVEAGQIGNVIRSGLGTAADYTLGVLSGTGNNIYGAAADVLSPAFATLGATSLAAELERKSDIAYNAARANIQNGYSATRDMTAADFDMEPADFDFAVARALADARNAPKTSRMGLATPGDRQTPMQRTKEDLSKATAAAPVPTDMEADARGQYRMFDKGKIMTAADLPAFKGRLENQAGPSGMEAEARKLPQGPQGAPAAQKGPTTMEADARGRKPLITSPAAVAAGLNDPTPEVREKTAADFAKEYAEFAPKYEGVDKGLMLAQIGFAIAAGESPNAMSNIANGLLAGSDAMIKDKAAKAEFDRQVKLNAMQYGFEEQGRERERGKPSLQFTALKDMTIKGRKVAEGDPVFLSYKDIEDAGGTVPSGLVDAATYTALAEKESGVLKAMQDQYDRGVMDDSDLRANVTDYTAFVNQVAQSQRALDYFEKSLFIIGKDGEVTGAKGALKSFVGKLAGFAGVDVAQLDSWAAAGDIKKLNEVLSRAVLDSVPSVLAGQSANSISNKDVDLAVGRLVEGAVNGGSFTNIFQNEDALIRQIQDSMGVIAANRQRAFAGMSSIEAQLANRYTKAGDFYAPSYASDVIAPLRGSVGLETTYGDPSTFGDITVGENGVWKLVLPGG